MNDKILTFEEYTMNDDFSSIRINEMAISLKDYRDKMDAYRIRLVENWCLCKYCQLYNKNHMDFKTRKEVEELDIFDFDNIPMSELDKAYIDYEPLYDTVDWLSLDED